jgi:dGTPase
MSPRIERLRFPVGATQGRRYPEPPHPYRNEFQRDRDRVVHARAFRRLENKTQVFTQGMSDHFRNRLTHTIEVSQIARTVAAVLGLDEDLTEALALAHDIGHPPFGHSGEEALDERMQRYGDRFDHNLHALRLVETFEQRYARFPGLNLTFEVREGIVKHSRDFERGEDPELDEYLPGLRPPLEAQLIDLADEVAYNTADLDDGFAADLFTMDDVATAVPHYSEIRDEIEGHFPGAPERILFQECLRRLIDTLASGLIEGTAESATKAVVADCEAVRTHPVRVACFTPTVAATNAALKQFLRTRVYSSEVLVAARGRSAQRVTELFDFFAAHPDSLPHPYTERTRNEPVHRVVCDYIAGMTDGYFERIYRNTFAIRS